MNDDAERMPRSIPEELLLARRAEQLVASMNALLSSWHVEASTLTARRLSRQPHIADEAARRASEMERQIALARDQFSVQLIEQDARLREHGKVADTLRAIDALLLQLEGPL